MIRRVCCLILLGSLEFVSLETFSQEAPVPEVFDREGGFELVLEATEPPGEDAQIFTPLSPVMVESEPVKLPEDQAVDVGTR